MKKLTIPVLIAIALSTSVAVAETPEQYGGYSASNTEAYDNANARQKPGYQRGHKQNDAGDAILTHLVKTLRRLGLDDTQKAEIRDIMIANREDLKTIHEATKANREALRAAVTADPFVEADLANVAQTEGELTAERMVVAGTAVADILALLTPEQRAELEALKEERRGKGKGPKS